MTAALRCAAPRTNRSSGSVSLHSPFETQARSSAATARGVLFTGTRFIGRAAGPVPDNGLSLRPAASLRPPPLTVLGCAPQRARLCDLHPAAQVIGSASIAQQFFGTHVPFLGDVAEKRFWGGYRRRGRQRYPSRGACEAHSAPPVALMSTHADRNERPEVGPQVDCLGRRR